MAQRNRCAMNRSDSKFRSLHGDAQVVCIRMEPRPHPPDGPKLQLCKVEERFEVGRCRSCGADYRLTAIICNSIRAPPFNAATCTVARAGGSAGKASL